MKFLDYHLFNLNIEIFEVRLSKCLSKLFCDSFRIASLSLSPFCKMVNIEEKSRILNFQRFHFPIEFVLKVAFNSLFEMKDHTIMDSFLVREVAEFPNCFAIWHPKMSIVM